MKIRTRLLLFLLPTFILSIALVSTLLAINWHKEILEGFRTKLRSAATSTAAMHPSKDQLEGLKNQLQVTDLYFVPIGSIEIDSIPKEIHITPIYTTKDGAKVMTGYSPVYDSHGYIMGVMAADINVSLINKKFQESLLLIILCAGFTIMIVTITLFLIANKISKPVQKLNNSALAIASGQYGESIRVQGPREIAELANTLNTMSECLFENINRLKENSLLRERLYGEYECAMLLQHLMLQKNIDDCRSDLVAIKSITLFSEDPKGLLVDFPKSENPNHFQIHLAEAEEEGFEGMYQLLTQYKLSKTTTPWINHPHYSTLIFDPNTSTLHTNGPHIPFCWSLDEEKFIPSNKNIRLVDSGDYLFLCNEGLIRFFKHRSKVEELIAKVLKIFASDGLETTAIMLQKELQFASKKRTIEEDIHLLCFQILKTGQALPVSQT